MKRILTSVSRHGPNKAWIKRMRAHHADPSQPKPGPNPTQHEWHYSDNSSVVVTVGADIPAAPIRVRCKYQRRILGLPNAG